MGITGFTRYMESHSEQYLEEFDLHDTYVVIDGYNITSKLYIWHTYSNSAFGGDYDEYEQCVRKFFEDLFKCNVTPLIILDGTPEDKKLQTRVSRLESKIKTAKFYTLSRQIKHKFLPALLGHVFSYVVKEMNIKQVRCLFEADNEIVAIAKLLNCPILSYDSDFYISGALYIPFNTMDINITKKLGKNVKCCKLYKVESLLNTFPGLDESVLPLTAILLGNDYIEPNILEDIRQSIKLSKDGQLLRNTQKCLVETIFHWLSKHTLKTAMHVIISNIPLNNKDTTLKIIKIIMDQFKNSSTNILIPLGFSPEEIIRMTSEHVKNNTNVEMNINHLETMKGFLETLKITRIDDSTSEAETFINNLPTWYIKEHHNALLPSFCLTFLLGKLHICSTQIEDFYQPSSVFISEKIMNVIFTLLTIEFKRNMNCTQYLTRGENNRLTQYPLKYINIFPCNIPPLHNLRNISLAARKEILDVTLGVKEQIDEFPINWRLYIATAKYWTEHLTNVRSDPHIYALLFAMLHHVIDAKIGYYRSVHKLRKEYKQKLLTLKSKQKIEPNHLPCSRGMSIIEALNAVEIDDCALIAPFFIDNGKTDQRLYRNPKKFRRSVLHLYAMFQNCIEYSFTLNALLGFPYEITPISKMYNGTLLYNLYNKFYMCNNIQNYINSILQCSPTLLQLFNVILIKAKLMFNMCATI